MWDVQKGSRRGEGRGEGGGRGRGGIEIGRRERREGCYCSRSLLALLLAMSYMPEYFQRIAGHKVAVM
jgi:hypothetical protein